MYERFYGLRERPFALSPDPDYLYPGRVHREALDYLRYGLDSHAGFIVMTGEIGSGKTTLLQTLLRGLDSKTTVGRIVNTMLEPRELLETILIDFGLDATGRSKPMMLQDLAEYLVAQRVAGRMVLLVIDEAQNLPLAALEELRMLSNIETEKSKLLQIVLVGQPNLRDKLAAPALEQLRQRITVSYHLQPLDAEETENYINHRLRRAAVGVPLKFPRDVTDLIHDRSRGIPRVVNVICDAALVFGYAEERRRVDVPLIHEVLTELETTGVLPAQADAREQIDVGAQGFAVEAQPRSLPPSIPASTPPKPASATPAGRAASPSAPITAPLPEPAAPAVPAPAIAAFAPRLDAADAHRPEPVEGPRREPAQGLRPAHVEGPRRPEPAEGPRPEPAEGPRPEPAEGPRPAPAEGPRPEPAEGPRPEPAEGPRPGPSEEPRPEPLEGPRPDLAQRPRPESAEGRRPEPAEGRRPALAEGPRPEPAGGRRPEPAEGRRPEPAEGRRPAFAEGPRPEPAEGTRRPSVTPPGARILDGVLATRAEGRGDAFRDEPKTARSERPEALLLDPVPVRRIENAATPPPVNVPASAGRPEATGPETLPIPPVRREAVSANPPDPMQTVRLAVDEALLQAARDEALRHPGRDEPDRREAKDTEIRIPHPDAASRAALDASLAQREAAIRQRERELAEQRRILAEEYRLLRVQRAAAAARSPARVGASGVPINLPSASTRGGSRLAPVRAERFWAWLKRIVGVSSPRVRHN